MPLKTNASITEGNALQVDWNSIDSKCQFSYIMGNPPFVGYTYQTKAQKNDLQSIEISTGKNIDYVSGWYFKAVQYMYNTNTRTAFVSTNSITQGEQVTGIWKVIFETYEMHIDFAYRTFIWDSEASQKAHVHCVIIGFSCSSNKNIKLFNGDHYQIVKNINGYLIPAPNIFVSRRTTP